MSDGPMRILCMGYCFPPVASPEAFVTSKTMAAIPDAAVDVVTAGASLFPQPPDHSLDDYVAKRFGRIERIDGTFLRALGKISRLPLRPDRYMLLTNAAAARAEAMGPKTYDCLVTRSQYHSVHAAGRQLKKRHPSLPWIACFSDPWSGGTYDRRIPLLSAFSRALEYSVLREANALVFPTAEMRDHFQSHHPDPDISDKSHVIAHGFDPELYPQSAQQRKDGPIRLGIFGTFYGPRSPRHLLEAVDRLAVDETLPDFRLETFGLGGEAFKRELAQFGDASDHVSHGGILPHTAALDRMAACDILIISDAPTPSRSIFLTSKIVDYLGTQRPLFAITPQGPTQDLIERVGGWSVDPADIAAIATTLANAISTVAAGQAASSAAVRNEYRIDNIGRQFRAVLDRVIAEGAQDT